MAILSITTSLVGQTGGLIGGVVPRQVNIVTTDNLATVTAAGYLNEASLQGYTIFNTDIINMWYGATAGFGTIASPGTFSQFTASISNGIATLVTVVNPGDVLLPVVGNHIAIFNGTTGQITGDLSPAINGGNIQAGLSGTAGTLSSFPPTAANGSFIFKAINNTGNFNSTLSNSNIGQATVYSLPDPGAASANILLSTSSSAQTIAGGLTLSSGNLTLSNASSLFIESFTDSITASATQTQAAATQLTSEVNRITVCAAIGNGVALPAAVSGLTIMVINHGANACQVYGNNASADTIDDVATGTGVSQMAGSVSFYVCATGGAAGKWYSEGIGTGYSGGLQTLYYVDSITTGTTQTQAGATALTGTINHITINATAKNGVALPAAKPGMQITVINDTALYCQVYGNNTAADTINGIATGTGVPQAANSVVTYNCVTAGNWVISSNVVAGGSGLAGTVSSFPATASKGSLIMAAVANTGNTNTTISNAAMGQASVISIPDPGAATANFVLDAGSQNVQTDHQIFVPASFQNTQFSTGTWTNTRIAQGDYGMVHTAAANSPIVAMDISGEIRTSASKGFELTSIAVVSKVGTLALTSATPTINQVIYANNVANAVTQLAFTGSLSTATQANPYVDVLTVTTPAYQGSNSNLVLEITYVCQATTALTFYGVILNFTRTVI